MRERACRQPMKNSTTAKDMTIYLTLDRELKDLEMQTAMVDCVMDELVESDTLDLDIAGTVLVKLESMIFRLRVAMRIFLDADLPEDDGSLLSQIFDLTSEVCDMRDELTEVLDEILGDSDEVLGAALAEDFDDEDDIFFVRVPAGAEVLIDGEPFDMSDLPADDDMVAIPLYADEVLVVDGYPIDIEDCEPGETYDIDDEDGDEGGLPDASFTVLVPCDADIEIDGAPVVFSINDVDDEGFIPLVLSEDAKLSLDGCAMDLSECEPGSEYVEEELEDDEDEVPGDTFTLWVPCGAKVCVDGDMVYDSYGEDELGPDDLVAIVVAVGSLVEVNGLRVDLSECEPGGEYEIAAED